MKEIIRKMKFRDTPLVLNAPSALEAAFVEQGSITLPAKLSRSSNILVFINNKQEFEQFLEKKLPSVILDSVLWFAYPKGGSGIQTDINRDIVRTTGEAFGITTVTAVSIDETWSALRFRPVEKVGK